MKTVSLVILAAITVLTPQWAAARDSCPQPDQVLDSPAWKEFTAGLADQYFFPADLDPADLPPRTLAKIMGHALGRQARHVGDDSSRREAFVCLQSGIDQSLARLALQYQSLVGRLESEELAENLSRLAREAVIGFYDEEISKLVGSGTEPSTPAVGVNEPQAAVEAPTTCRFNLHPNLFNSSHPNFRWYLLRRPWKGDGAYFDAVEANPEWPPASSKRPENNLRENQTIVLEGTKSEVAKRVQQLRASCGG